jgi:hypothetical protein
MKSLNHFLVKVEKRFNDTLDVAGKDIYLDSKWNEFENRICFGEIVSTPLRHDTGAKEGDTLFFHHHVTTTDTYLMDTDVYMSTYGEFRPNSIAYRRKEDGEIVMLGDWLFVQPHEVEKVDSVTSTGIVTELGINVKDRDVAKVVSPTSHLISQGVKGGDIVGFSKDADYKMTLDDGSVVYRMTEDHLLYVEES